MKALHKILLTATISFAVCMVSCKKDNYLKDGGLNNPVTMLSTYEYLKSNRYHYFDTTLLLIDHFNLQDSVNKAGTFFAFTNFSVNALMKTLQVRSLDSLYGSISSRIITQYMFSDSSITLDNVGLTSVQYTNWASDTIRTYIKKIPATYGVYLNSSNPVFSYYVLQFIFVNGALDGSTGPVGNDPLDQTTSCQTTGIKTASGTMLHVLVNNALIRKQ